MKFFIPHQIGKVIKHLTKTIPQEYTLFGKTQIVGEVVNLVDIRVPIQESTGANTEVSPDNMEAFLMELIDSGENPKDWNMWIHSHNTMGAFWSGTDTDQQQSFNSGVPSMFFHMVVSTLGSKGAFSLYKPFNLLADNIEIEWEKEPAEYNPRIALVQEKIVALQAELKAIADEVPEVVSAFLAEVTAKNTIKTYTLPHHHTPYDDEDTPPDPRDFTAVPRKFGKGTWFEMLQGNYADSRSYLDPRNDDFWAKELERLATITKTHKSKCKCNNCERYAIADHAVCYTIEQSFNEG